MNSARTRARTAGRSGSIDIFNFAYNFIKIRRTLRMTPAMAAGVSTRLMDVSDLVTLLIESEPNAA